MRRIKSAFVLLILLSLSLVAPMINAAAAQPIPDVKFADAWFGDLNNKIEVEPGDKAVQLIVQLVNTEDKPFRYAEGILHLPDGFRDSTTGEQKTRLSVTQQIPSGGYFYFKFLIDIGEDVKIGEHQAKLEVRYVEWDEDDLSQTFIKINFRVTGKAVINTEISPSEIEPGDRQATEVILKNMGTAEASDVELWIESTSPGLAILEGQGRHKLGNLAPGELVKVPVTVIASRAIADTTAALKLVVSYLNSYGIRVTETQTVSLKIEPLGGVAVVLDVYAAAPILEPAQSTSLEVIVANRGTAVARDVNVMMGFSQLPNPPITLLKGESSIKLGDIAPGEEKKIRLEVFVNELASGRSYSIPVSLTYADEEGRHVIQTGLTLTILEESRRNRLRIYTEEYVRGGMIEKVNITVENIAGEELRDITLTLSPMVGWVTLLGPTTWNIPKLESGEKAVLKLEMYVPSETAAGSTIGEPFNLKVDASFRDKGGQIRSEVHVLGMYVKGIIELRLQEISIERLGEDILLIGRLLNEGTEKASYTQVQLIGGDLQSSIVSYLGDVEPNAPILFNIPVEKLLKTEGKAKIKLKVTYQNSLRQKGETILEAEVDIPSFSEESAQAEAPNLLQEMRLPLVILLVIIAAAVVIYFARRSRRVEAT